MDLIKDKIISPVDAANMVNSGDLVVIPVGREPAAICYSLAARMSELRNVRLAVGLGGRDFGWYDEGWEQSFQVETHYVMPLLMDGMAKARFDFVVHDVLMRSRFDLDREIDVLLLSLSYPDKHGYCSFGGSVWYKKQQVQYSKLVIAELVPNTIRTYGDNFIHCSEIDYFVEHVPVESGRSQGMRGGTRGGSGETERRIADHVAGLIKDGDTIQIGIGSSTEALTDLGCFEGKNDLGIHSELIPGAVIRLVQSGVITGTRKTLNRGVAVATAVGGGHEEYAIVDGNPAFRLYGADYVNDPAIIARNDNLVAINTALSVDIYGQVMADSLGFRMVAGVGGQLSFAVGASISKGGRYIVALPSMTPKGESRIVFTPPVGTVVSVPRNLAGYVVTEYGVACLRGASQRRRAEALVAIAHPDVRGELTRKMKSVFWGIPSRQGEERQSRQGDVSA